MVLTAGEAIDDDGDDQRFPGMYSCVPWNHMTSVDHLVVAPLLNGRRRCADDLPEWRQKVAHGARLNGDEIE
jgi:hypothetical protein